MMTESQQQSYEHAEVLRYLGLESNPHDVSSMTADELTVWEADVRRARKALGFEIR